MRVINKSGNEIVFEIDRFKSIIDTMIEQILNEYNFRNIAFRPREPFFDDIKILNNQVSKKYFFQLGFIAERNNLVLPEKCTEMKSIREYKPGNIDELLDFFENNWVEYFFIEYKDYFSNEMKEEWFGILRNVSTLENTMILSNDKEEKIAIIMKYESKDCIGNKVTQVGWIWVKSDVDYEQRKQIHYQLISRLKNKSEKLIQAGVHVSNIRSQKFFMKAGFKPVCVHLFR